MSKKTINKQKYSASLQTGTKCMRIVRSSIKTMCVDFNVNLHFKEDSP